VFINSKRGFWRPRPRRAAAPGVPVEGGLSISPHLVQARFRLSCKPLLRLLLTTIGQARSVDRADSRLHMRSAAVLAVLSCFTTASGPQGHPQGRLLGFGAPGGALAPRPAQPPAHRGVVRAHPAASSHLAASSLPPPPRRGHATSPTTSNPWARICLCHSGFLSCTPSFLRPFAILRTPQGGSDFVKCSSCAPTVHLPPAPSSLIIDAQI
jgi:hypothetical protein